MSQATEDVTRPLGAARPLLDEPRRPNGAAVAASLAAAIGIVVMALVNVGTEASQGFKTFVHGVGKLWIPGAQGIGPYSGKETFLLLGWLGSWAALHYLLRRRGVSGRTWGMSLTVLFLVGFALFWPPIFTWAAELLS